MSPEEAMRLIEAELRKATSMHGTFHNAHEGFAVLLEEVDELKGEVWKNPAKHPERMGRIREEAVQVGAMAARILVDLTAAEQP
jgi:hypothetical protein